MNDARTLRSVALALIVIAACATRGSGRSYVVRVENESGRPIEGARVDAYVLHDLLVFGLHEGCTATHLARGDTGKHGTFAFMVRDLGPPPSQSVCYGSSVRVTYRDWPDQYARLEPPPYREKRLESFEKPPDRATTILVRIGPPRTARGTVRWQPRAACKEAPEVHAYEFFDPGPFPWDRAFGAVRSRSPVGEDGAFELGGIGTGRVRILARHCERSAETELDRSSAAPIVLDLRNGAAPAEE